MDDTKYVFDYEQSKALFDKYKSIVEPKMCYNNIYHVACYEVGRIKNNKFKVAYGYISLNEEKTLYARHCFFVSDNTVIDPTIIANHKDNNECYDYLVFKVFDSYEEYIRAIESEENHYPALDNTLRRLDFEFMKDQHEHGKFFIS